jgi:hypothetical protein
MDYEQTERLIAAVESIAKTLDGIWERGLDVHTGIDRITVDAMICAPDGIQITQLPDDLFVQVLNPQSLVTGDIKPFITKAN